MMPAMMPDRPAVLPAAVIRAKNGWTNEGKCLP